MKHYNIIKRHLICESGCTKALIILLVTSFVWIQVTLRSRNWHGNYHNYGNPRHMIVRGLGYRQNEIETADIPATRISKHIKMKIEEANEAQAVYNEDMYGPLTNESVVIVVQVHDRITYLKNLIQSFSTAQNINQTLLIFSHDIYDTDINNLIQDIKFCKVMQIYFPHSIETHPKGFPGDDPRDCPRNIQKARALEIGCQNALFPDRYGHYRESKFTQIKHHWWWKLNYVFNSLKITFTFGGLVLFLEEDHYVAQDFLHVLRLMSVMCQTIENCKFFTLGSQTKLTTGMTRNSSHEVKLTNFISNLGLALDREAYSHLILNCAREFCEYDDYNWDWSLNYINTLCFKTPKLAITVNFPRVFHIGQCGTHVHEKNCEERSIISTVQDALASVNLFPSALKLVKTNQKRMHLNANGGWGDRRDQELCLNMTKSSRL